MKNKKIIITSLGLGFIIGALSNTLSIVQLIFLAIGLGLFIAPVNIKTT